LTGIHRISHLVRNKKKKKIMQPSKRIA